MRGIIRIIRYLAIFFATFLLITFLSWIFNPQVIAFEDFPLNQTQVINFDFDENRFKQLTDREKKEQIRDWLLFTIVSDKTFSADEINKSLYDLLPVRHGYLKPISNFEYGDTRSLYVGKNTVVALLPKEIAQQQRIDYLGHIADYHRQNLGKIPKTLEIFEYEISNDQQTAKLTRTKPLDAKQVFSTEEYNYHETEITNLNNLNNLNNFLKQIDAITFAQVKEGNLVLGGREINSYSYGKISLENVAAIWQSEKKIQEKIANFEEKYHNLSLNTQPLDLTTLQQKAQEEAKKLKLVNGSGFSLDPSHDYKTLITELNKAKPLIQSLKLDGKPIISEEDIKQAQTGLAQQNIVLYLELIEKLKENVNNEKVVPDLNDIEAKVKINKKQKQKEFKNQVTQYQKQLEKEIEQKIETAKKSGQSPEVIQQNVEDFIKLQKQKYKNFQIQLNQKYKSEIEQLAKSQIQQKINQINNFVDTPSSQGFQSARYDGDLQGTEVGMVLFYTDLLAKLWALDYLGTTSSNDIPEFQPLTQKSATVSPIYKKELKELSKTRLWFGHQDKGFQVADNGDSLLFAHNATRVYSVSSNPLNPGKETTAAANSEAFLGWWNDHYEEVARYEPQYERLNEIMKWSLIISWLNESNNGDLLSFLQDVQVKRNYWFPDWIQAHKGQLKFQKWASKHCSNQLKTNSQAPVCFYEKGYKGTTTETMPLLRSKSFSQFGQSGHSFEGGVSLAYQNLFKDRTPLPKSPDIDDLSLRSNIDYKSDAINLENDTLTFTTLEGTTYQINAVNISSTAKAKEGTKFRSPEVEVANLEYTRHVSRTDNGIKINTAADGIDLGNFTASKTKNGFTAGWESRDFDAAQSLIFDLSNSTKNPEEFLTNDPRVESMAKQTDSNVYYVKMNGMENGFQLASGGGGNGNIPPTWKFHLASPQDPSRSSNFRNGRSDGSGGSRGSGGSISSGDDSYFLLAWLDKKQINKTVDEGKAEWRKGSSDSSNPPKNTPNIVALDAQIKKIDELLRNNQLEQALIQIDNAIKTHEQKTNLILIKAFVLIKEGKLKAERLILENGTSKFVPEQKVIWDEVYESIKQNKKRFKRVKKDNAVMAIQDTPDLNNIDWNQSISASFSEFPKTRVYRIQDTDINNINLKSLGFGDGDDDGGSSNPGSSNPGGGGFDDYKKYGGQNPFRGYTMIPYCLPNEQSPDNDQNGKEDYCDDEFYIIVEES